MGKAAVNTNPNAEVRKPLFSIIIPVYREEALVNSCLEQLGELDRVSEIEVILSDGDEGSTLKTIDAAGISFPMKTIIAPMGRGVQQNRGAEASQGGILVFLHVDTRMPRNALHLIERALQMFRAGCFSLGINTAHGFLNLGQFLANTRARMTKIPYGDQVYFFRRETFFSLGGFQELPVMEDVALMIELKKKRIPIAILQDYVLTSARRWDKEGAIRGTFRNWALYIFYRLGVSPATLAKRYRPQSELQ
jgi:rSAM/selenodomain-associated transferase 2